MKKNEFKFFIAIVALVVVSATFFGSYWLYNQYGVEKPLANRINSIAGVENVTIGNQDRELTIDVQLKNIDNLQSKYEEIKKAIDSVVKNKQYQLNIKYQRDEKLQNAYDNVQLMVYEAIANNRYLWLKEQMKPELKGITYKLFVDENRLYIQMQDGDHFLYEVINRQQDNNTVVK
ncbi:MAG: hypothetical protein ABFC94_17980 [Syntrophomonas sp.]